MIESLLEELSERGWMVNNLFQLSPTVWQANLRSPTHHTAFAQGPTAAIALDNAMVLLEDPISTPDPPTCAHSIAELNKSLADMDVLATILANLRQSQPSGLRTRKL